MPKWRSIKNAFLSRPTWRSSLDSLAWRESIEAVSSMATAQTRFFDDATSLRAYALSEAPSEGLLCEFGVFQGKTMSQLANQLVYRNDPRKLYGFDSFDGFTEEWTGVEDRYTKEFFATEVPKDLPPNCELVIGPIEETFADFVERQGSDGFAFLHIDTDTYSPCFEVLRRSYYYLKDGAVIVFDELLGYNNWRSHEWAALHLVLERHEWEAIAVGTSGPSARLIKVAVRISK